MKDTSQRQQADFTDLLEMFILGERGVWLDSKFFVSGMLLYDGDIISQD